MATESASSHVRAPNSRPEALSDDLLLRGFLLSLGAAGRKPKTAEVYRDSIRALSDFAHGLGLPGLVEMDRTVIRHWLTSLYQKGNSAATVSVRYRSCQTFFKWCQREGERDDNPMVLIDPPKIPYTVQPWYSPDDVERVLKATGRDTVHNFRDTAIVLTLFDAGVRIAELTGMMVADVDWHERTILVTGKAGNQRYVSIGHKTTSAVERYLRKRRVDSPYLWLGSANKPLALNGVRMILHRRFKDAGVTFRGAHAFRRGFAMSFLESGGQEGDLKQLGGWTSFAMVQRYARASAGERAVKAHKLVSPGDRLNVR